MVKSDVIGKAANSLVFLMISLLFTACGGSSGSNPSSPINQSSAPADPIGNELPDISCDTKLFLPINRVAADYQQDNYAAEKSIDTSFSQESRWQSNALDQSIQFELSYRSLIKSLDIAWYLGNQREALFSVAFSDDEIDWRDVLTSVKSSGLSNDIQSFEFDPISAQYLKIISHGNEFGAENGVVEVAIQGCNNESVTSENLDELITRTSDFDLTDYTRLDLDPRLPPSQNFDLQDWYLSIPTDEDGSGTSDSIKENELNSGYEDRAFFYTGDDGGLVFKSPTTGFKTSTNTSYVRVELREMLRRGNTQHSTQGVNKNNWVFGSASETARDAAGGVDGRLFATLAVNQVTSTGLNYQIGRIIIGQIHANDDEPVRLYYRKLPDNSHGAIYLAHEVKGGDDRNYEMIGSRANETDNPIDGIALDEKFSYEIEATGNILVVSIHRPGKESVVQTVDMRESGYDSDDQYQYFKAGVYHVNNSADEGEFAQATFYELNNSHDKYAN
ncbi:MAG: polysaccharide lyase family 7 protein [Kangiellaceae bacterium]|nr:polysaccharide lyase family 7 protein [Kangiellaceae bacterium]